jgi:hypothetical protein
MSSGFQTQGLSYWDHGSMVTCRFRDLMNPNPNPSMVWRLPTWFTEHADWIRKQLEPYFDDIITYQQWHDLGKSYCRTVDAEGKIHYPEHASTSEAIWVHLGGDRWIGELIGQDMLCHQLRPADAAEFAKNPNALILLCTALCELHANATMFGGIESDSFKIKAKRLTKIGKIILSVLQAQSPERDNAQAYLE